MESLKISHNCVLTSRHWENNQKKRELIWEKWGDEYKITKRKLGKTVFESTWEYFHYSRISKVHVYLML